MSDAIQLGGLYVSPATISAGGIVISTGNVSLVRAVSTRTFRGSRGLIVALTFAGVLALMMGVAQAVSIGAARHNEPTGRWVVGGIAAAVFAVACLVLIVWQARRYDNGFALLITANSGDTIRVDYPHPTEAMRAVDAVRGALSSRGVQAVYQTLVLNQPNVTFGQTRMR